MARRRSDPTLLCGEVVFAQGVTDYGEAALVETERLPDTAQTRSNVTRADGAPHSCPPFDGGLQVRPPPP
jgi:hypothetical protein